MSRRALILTMAVVLLASPVQVQAGGVKDAPPASDYEGMPPLGLAVGHKDWTWSVVDERGIALGGGGLDEEDVLDLRERGFGAILNLRQEYPDEEEWVREAGLEYGYVPVGYSEEDIMTVDQMEEAADFIARNLEEGRAVYVHCIGGWHRSASAIVAFWMKTNGWRFEEAWAELQKVRPKIETRYAESLLLYEAHLFDEPKLNVDMWAEGWEIKPGEPVQATAYVSYLGEPVEGAEVVFSPDYDPDQMQDAMSDADGLVHFNYTAETDSLMQFIHVWATKDGFLDGYYRNQFWVREEKVREPIEIELDEWEGPVSPGEPVTLSVKVRETDGSVANPLITITSPCKELFRDYTGWDGKVDVTFDAPLENGTYPIHIRANYFPVEPASTTAELVVGDGGPTPACGAQDEPEQHENDTQEPVQGDGGRESDGNEIDSSAASASVLKIGRTVAALAAIAAVIVAGARLWKRD